MYNSDKIDLNEEFLEWWHESLFFRNAQILGKSIKFIRSGLPSLVLELPSQDLNELKQHLLDGGSISQVTEWHFDDNKSWCKLNLNEEFLCLLQADDLLEDNNQHQLEFIFEELRFNLEVGVWQGSELAIQDLKDGLLRPLSLPGQSLGSVAILGIIALAAQLDMAITSELQEKIHSDYNESEMKALSQRKLGKTFKKIMLARRPSRAFLLMQGMGILQWYFPELSRGFGLEQNRFHKYDIFHHCIYSCDAVSSPDLGLRLAALFHDLGKVDTRRDKGNGEASFHNHEYVSVKHARHIMFRFGLGHNKALFDRVIFLVRNHMFHYTEEWTDKAIRRFIQKIGTNKLDDLIALRLADRKGSGKRSALPRAITDMMKHITVVKAKEAELKIHDLKITGHDLMEIGMPAGPRMGDVLKQLLLEVKEKQLENNNPALQERTKEIFIEFDIHLTQTRTDIKPVSEEID